MKTYDEICHALKCCWIQSKCPTCPYHDDDPDIMECTSNLAGEAVILIESLKRDNDRLLKSLNLTQQEQYTNGRSDGIKEFAERLCDGRVSNDPVVIAVKCAVEEITEGNGK